MLSPCHIFDRDFLSCQWFPDLQCSASLAVYLIDIVLDIFRQLLHRRYPCQQYRTVLLGNRCKIGRRKLPILYSFLRLFCWQSKYAPAFQFFLFFPDLFFNLVHIFE